MGIAVFRAGAVGLLIFLSAPAQLRLCVRTDPLNFDPLSASDEASETIRYLTGGVLIRFNRRTQQLEPELAKSWQVRDSARRIDFVLRDNVRFSDGTLFGPADVIATIRRINDAKLISPIADTFRTAGGEVSATANGPNRVSVTFSAPVAGLELLFDQLAIAPAGQLPERAATLGPFLVKEYRSGQYVLLVRNPHFWKIDASGKRLPYLDTIRLDIQSNRDTELLRFRRGELDLVDKLDPEAFDRLRKEMPAATLNAGPSLDAEFFWFNQSSTGSVPSYKERWFQSKPFRRAVSAAVNRRDIVRLVYHGYAVPAIGPISPVNRFWFNSKVDSAVYDPQLAVKLLRQDGFRFDGKVLSDANGNRVEFSVITNAGSKARGQIGAMMQQDLRAIGIQVNFTPIEFQSLLERIMRTQQYEVCLLGLTNVEIDPNTQMNVWLSSGTHHAWNPGQAKPATAWEAEIDRLMAEQHTAMASKSRKQAFDRVQEIVAEQAPIVYLVHPDVLVAVSPSVRNAFPSALPPHLLWNVEQLSLAADRGNRH